MVLLTPTPLVRRTHICSPQDVVLHLQVARLPSHPPCPSSRPPCAPSSACRQPIAASPPQAVVTCLPLPLGLMSLPLPLGATTSSSSCTPLGIHHI
ncbi:hypothetical protein ACP70R_012126 [Stipagrostis hirtigluma subsp. patula]